MLLESYTLVYKLNKPLIIKKLDIIPDDSCHILSLPKHYIFQIDMLPLSYAMSKNSAMSRLEVGACSGDQNYDP